MVEFCLPSLQQVHARHLSDIHVGILRHSTAQRFHQQLSLELLVLGVHFSTISVSAHKKFSQTTMSD